MRLETYAWNMFPGDGLILVLIDLIYLQLWELQIIFAKYGIKFNVNFLKISITAELKTCDSSLFHSIIAEGKIINENIFKNVLAQGIKFSASLKKQHNIYY